METIDTTTTAAAATESTEQQHATHEVEEKLQKLDIAQQEATSHAPQVEVDLVDPQPLASEKHAHKEGGAGLATGTSPRSESGNGEDTGSHGSGIKLGLFGSGQGEKEDDFVEEDFDDDDLEKEYLHADDVELLEYQRQRSTPKIVI